MRSTPLQNVFFTEDHFFFKGHFPSYPVVPGVILVETLAQCGGAGLIQTGILPHGAFFVLASIEKAKFETRYAQTTVLSLKYIM